MNLSTRPLAAGPRQVREIRGDGGETGVQRGFIVREMEHLRHFLLRPAGGTGDNKAAARTGRVASRRSMTAAPIEWPISTGGTGSPAATCSTSAAKSSRPVTNIVARPPDAP